MRIIQKYQNGYKSPNRVRGQFLQNLSNNGEHYEGNYLVTNQQGDSTINMTLGDNANGKLNFEDVFYTNTLPEASKNEGIPQQSDGRFRVIGVHNNYGLKNLYPGDPQWEDYYNRLKYRMNELFGN